MAFDVIEAPTFWESVAALRRDDPYKAHLVDTQIELRSQPFKNPRLQTHDIGKAANGRTVYSSDVGGRKSDRRLVWQLFNETIVLLLYGTHAVQDRAKRMRIDLDPNDRIMTVVEQVPDTGEERPWDARPTKVGRAFMAWKDAELLDFGLPEHVIPALRELDRQDDLLHLAGALGDADFDRAFNLIAYGHPDGEEAAASAAAAEATVEAVEPEPTDEDRDLESKLRDPALAGWFTRTEPEFMRAVLDRPIEDWMVFLHPDQRKVVEATYTGPARVRGAAGTGKTVVALHRASVLARRFGPAERILFVTFADHLVPVLRELFGRLPDATSGRVDFLSVGGLARGYCEPLGIAPASNAEATDAFDASFADQSLPGSPIFGLSAGYVRSEIEAVIRGRALHTVDEYLEASRRGRRVGLTEVMRRSVWAVHEAWREALEPVLEMSDLVARALAVARDSDPRWRSAIVDEAQDLTMAGLGLVQAAVSEGAKDRADGLFLCGDGAQKVLPGGYTLRQAGVEVRGRRTTVLRQNYRTTAEIMAAALEIAGAAEIVDLDEEFRRGEARPESSRSGPEPELLTASSPDEEIETILQSVQRLVTTGSAPAGDIAVLVPPMMLDGMLAAFTTAGTEFQPIEDYDGRTNSLVKVGTWSGSKGLEFKAVVVGGCGRSSFPSPAEGSEWSDEQLERHQLELSQLFVSMTRARDILILTSAGEPAAEVVGASAHLSVAGERSSNG
jgi:hypothetical protein